MTKPPESVLLDRWRRWSRWPGGRLLFSALLRWIVPYSSTIRPRVLELRSGYARVEMRDRSAVRNHLNSIHAIAVMNLAELTGGLAVVAALPPDARGIPIALSVSYPKKARGRLTAECACTVPAGRADTECDVGVIVRDPAGDVVAQLTARWRIGPRAGR